MDLRHEALETRDLAGALSDVAQQMTTGTALNATVRTVGPVRPLGPSDEHHLLRIGLEAVTNTIKHARATTVDVVLRFDDDAVHLVVTDDGSGFVETRPDRVRRPFRYPRHRGTGRQDRRHAATRQPVRRRRGRRGQSAHSGTRRRPAGGSRWGLSSASCSSTTITWFAWGSPA